MEINKEVLKGYIDTMLLSRLAQSDMYGYELAKSIRTMCQDEFEIKEGTMYLALKRLEKHGFVESYWNDEEATGGGRRKYYRALPLGHQQLHEKKAEWQFVQQIMNRFFEEGLS